MTTSAEVMFEEWWERTGQFLDPDSIEVSWHDKRKGLAGLAFMAAIAQSRNYTADREQLPSTMIFANGRIVFIGESGFLVTDVWIPENGSKP